MCVVLGRKLKNLFRFSFSGTRNIIFGTLKIGQNDPEIQNLEFESHCFLENQVFLPTSWDKYMLNDISRHKFQDMSSLVRLEGNILPKQHIVQCQSFGEREFAAIDR